jgi:hypothetical protein
VYIALRRRIHLFESVVGQSQPILAKMSSVIAGHVLGSRTRDPKARAALTAELEQEAERARREGLDLDALLDSDLQEPARTVPKLTLHDLDMVLQSADSLPAGPMVKKLSFQVTGGVPLLPTG